MSGPEEDVHEMRECRWCEGSIEDGEAVAVISGEHAGDMLHRSCLDALRQRSLAELRQLSLDA